MKRSELIFASVVWAYLLFAIGCGSRHTVSNRWVLIFEYPDETYRDFILSEAQVIDMLDEMEDIFFGL